MHIVRKGRKIRVYQSISVKKKTGNLPCLSALLPSLPKAAVFMVQIFMGQVFIVQTSVVCPFLRYLQDLSPFSPCGRNEETYAYCFFCLFFPESE